ncbi:unnamed protein product [Phaeothamnion confervicola]
MKRKAPLPAGAEARKRCFPGFPLSDLPLLCRTFIQAQAITRRCSLTRVQACLRGCPCGRCGEQRILQWGNIGELREDADQSQRRHGEVRRVPHRDHQREHMPQMKGYATNGLETALQSEALAESQGGTLQRLSPRDPPCHSMCGDLLTAEAEYCREVHAKALAAMLRRSDLLAEVKVPMRAALWAARRA